MAKEQKRQFSPLFPHDPELGQEPVYADEIKTINIYRHSPTSANKNRRVKVAKSEFIRENEDGEMEEFVFNPLDTTEDDIEEWFGGGDYYLQPIGHDNLLLKNAKSIHIASRRDDYDDEEEELPAPPPPPAPPDNSEKMFMWKMMSDMMASKDRAINDAVGTKADAATQLMSQFAAIQSLTGQKNDGTVETLRSQLNEATSQYREDLRRRDREIEELRSANRAELERRDRQHEEYRRHSMDELAEIRKRTNDETAELRRRLTLEVDEARERYKRDLQHETDRLALKAKDLQQEMEAKARRVHELEKETLELQRDLASTPEAAPTPPAAEVAPWWAGMAGQVLKEVGKISANRPLQAPPPPQPAVVYQQIPQAPQAPQAPQQYQPAAPQPAVRMAPPPPPAPMPDPSEPAPMEFTSPTLYGGPASATSEQAAA